MTQEEINQHVANREMERVDYQRLWEGIQWLNTECTLSKSTIDELQAKISSRIAFCEISIRDHLREKIE